MAKEGTKVKLLNQSFLAKNHERKKKNPTFKEKVQGEAASWTKCGVALTLSATMAGSAAATPAEMRAATMADNDVAATTLHKLWLLQP